jgi:hypothetical protein
LRAYGCGTRARGRRNCRHAARRGGFDFIPSSFGEEFRFRAVANRWPYFVPLIFSHHSRAASLLSGVFGRISPLVSASLSLPKTLSGEGGFAGVMESGHARGRWLRFSGC